MRKHKYASFSSAKEALSKMKINLSFIDIEKKVKCIIVTSAVPNEGKSLISKELATSLATGGEHVLLIDADMRKPTQHNLFSVNNRVGLSQMISSRVFWQDCVINSQTDGLSLITAGKIPPNPANILANMKMKLFLDEAKRQYDYIIIDTPPVIPVPDATALSGYVDGVFLVTRYGKTTRKQVEEAKRALSIAKAPLIGAILNNVSIKSSKYKYSY